MDFIGAAFLEVLSGWFVALFEALFSGVFVGTVA